MAKLDRQAREVDGGEGSDVEPESRYGSDTL
jgi:hypothetical protein